MFMGELQRTAAFLISEAKLVWFSFEMAARAKRHHESHATFQLFTSSRPNTSPVSHASQCTCITVSVCVCAHASQYRNVCLSVYTVRPDIIMLRPLQENKLRHIQYVWHFQPVTLLNSQNLLLPHAVNVKINFEEVIDFLTMFSFILFSICTYYTFK